MLTGSTTTEFIHLWGILLPANLSQIALKKLFSFLLTIQSFKINSSGSVRINCTTYYTDLKINVNGVQVAYTFSDSTNNCSEDIVVSEGDVITLSIAGRKDSTSTSYNYLEANSLVICGTLTPLMQTNLIEVTEV